MAFELLLANISSSLTGGVALPAALQALPAQQPWGMFKELGEQASLWVSGECCREEGNGAVSSSPPLRTSFDHLTSGCVSIPSCVCTRERV